MANPPPDDVKVLYTLLDPVNNSVIQEFKATQDAKVHSSYLTNFREGSPLGEGGFAVVTKCQNVLDEQWYAVKKAYMAEEEATGKPRYLELEESFESLKVEAKTLAALHHPNIVRFHMSWTETNFCGTGSEDFTLFRNSPCLFILQELCERLNSKNARITEEEIAKTFSDIVKGLKYIHTEGIMHGDLHPANILYKDGTAKIADFGLARKAGTPMGQSGNHNYHSPEMIKGEPAATSHDIFSLGMVLFEMLQPFRSDQARVIIMKDLAKKKIFPKGWTYDNPLRELVNDMIDEIPSKRPSAAHLQGRLKEICKYIHASRLPAE